MPNYDFKKDLPIAKKTEHEVAELLVRLYSAEIVEFEDTNKYDFKAIINGKTVTFEVKEDFSCEKTGNVGLEFECRGKPSGIAVSEANFYIYKVHTKFEGIKFILHPVKIIKQMIADKKYFRIVDGGDRGSHSMNYLFKYNVFLENSNVLPVDKIT